jgi:hypothetical protein
MLGWQERERFLPGLNIDDQTYAHVAMLLIIRANLCRREKWVVWKYTSENVAVSIALVKFIEVGMERKEMLLPGRPTKRQFLLEF